MENETSLSSYACYGGSSEHITSVSAKSVKKINKVQIAKMIAVVLTIAVWILLSLPTVFYQLRQKDKVQLMSSKCSAKLYANNTSVCYSSLLHHKDSVDNVLISSSINVQESEETASRISNYLSPQCSSVALPFICRYLFPLCDENQTLSQPSYVECNTISMGECRSEWKGAVSAGDLPDCGNLDEYNNNSSSSNIMALNCSKDFILIDNECLPDCPNWALGEKHRNILAILAASIGLIFTPIVLLISCLRYKKMLSFPAVLIVYQTFPAALLLIFAMIAFVDPKSFCSAPDWIRSLNHSTTICAISGSVFYYSVMQLVLLWLFHVCTLFWNVRFPIQAMVFTKKHGLKYIHSSMLGAATIIPVIPVVVMFNTGGFINGRFPPLFCLARSEDAAVYTTVVPVTMMMSLSVSLLIWVCWTLYRQFHMSGSMALGKAEKKVLIVITYFVLLATLAVASFSHYAVVKIPSEDALSQYFTCERLQPGNCEAYKDEAEKYKFPGLSESPYILVSLFPVVNLVYVFNHKELKDIFTSLIKKCCT